MLVSSCATKTPKLAAYPEAADLQPKAKPLLADGGLKDEGLYEAWNREVEAWGEDRDRAVARICRWAVTNGAELPFKCPLPPPDS